VLADLIEINATQPQTLELEGPSPLDLDLRQPLGQDYGPGPVDYPLADGSENGPPVDKSCP